MGKSNQGRKELKNIIFSSRTKKTAMSNYACEKVGQRNPSQTQSGKSEGDVINSSVLIM